MCNSFLSIWVFFQIPHSVYRAITRVARKSAFNGAAIFCERAPYQRIVGAFGAMFKELVSKIGLCLWSLGNQQQPASIFVDAVHQSDIGIVDVQFVAEIPCQGVQQCVFIVAMSWVNHHACGFVDYQHIVVLIYHFQWDIFGMNRIVMWFVIKQYLYDIQWFYLIVATYSFAINPYVACIRCTLDTTSRSTRHVLC